jgi:hypothetical protein
LTRNKTEMMYIRKRFSNAFSFKSIFWNKNHLI